MSRADERISLFRGYAWHVYQDQAVTGGVEGAHPFGAEAGGPVDAAPDEHLPEVVGAAWTVPPVFEGLVNHAVGGRYVVLTSRAEPPPVDDGWDAEPARLEESFNMEQRGARWVRLKRVLATRDHGGKALMEVEMEVDRT